MSVTKKPENPIIVALDGMTVDDSLKLAERLKGKVWGFKANDLADAPPIVNYDERFASEPLDLLSDYGGVFLDLKFHDIGNTVVNRISRWNERLEHHPDLITVHASGGIDMMRRAVEKDIDIVCGGETDTGILAVSVLTSIGEEVCNLAYGGPVKAKVLLFAQWAKLAGVIGMVCSAKELKFLSKFPELASLIKVTPAIRPAWHPKTRDQDPSRITTIEQAIEFGTDFMVMGSVFTNTDDPVGAAEKTMAEVIEVRTKLAG